MTSIFADGSDHSQHSDWDNSSGHIRPIPKVIIQNQKKNPNTEPRPVEDPNITDTNDVTDDNMDQGSFSTIDGSTHNNNTNNHDNNNTDVNN